MSQMESLFQTLFGKKLFAVDFLFPTDAAALNKCEGVDFRGHMSFGGKLHERG